MKSVLRLLPALAMTLLIVSPAGRAAAVPGADADASYTLPPIPEPLGTERRTPLLEYERDLLAAWLPGIYDNQEQVSWADNHKIAVPPRQALRVHALPAAAAPWLDAPALLVRGPASTEATRLWSLTPDEQARAVRIRIHTLRQPVQIDAGALPDLPVFNRRAARLQRGCDLLAYRDGDGFRIVRESPAADCAGALALHDGAVLRVLRDELWLANHEGGSDPSVAPWLRLERARWFACMLDIPPTPGARPTRTARYFKLYDQGGTLPFTHPDGRPMTVLMRNTWSYGMQRETLFVGVLDGDVDGATLAYAWAQPGADRIGVNPGFLRVQCDLDTPEMLELQHRLRPDS